MLVNKYTQYKMSTGIVGIAGSLSKCMAIQPGEK